MTQISGAWLNRKATKQIAALFNRAGYQIFFVGGCVRNTLLGQDVADIDMATNALPQTGIDLSRAAGLKAIPTGIDHGTITVIAEGIPHEITTFRTDVATDGRHAEVVFSDSLLEDAQRRDFTMNALYSDVEGLLHDPINGLPDLRARKIKFVGDAHQRIEEDFLRVLRFFRFHAWYGDPASGLDQDGLAACAGAIDGLASLSRERVGAEMVKLLSAPDPAPAIASMAQAGILNATMQGADPKALAPLVYFEAGRTVDWRRRAAVLGGSDLANTWRLSKRDATHLRLVREEIGSLTALHSLAYRHGSEVAINVALARAAIYEQPPSASMDKDIREAANTVFPVKAVDLPNLSGPALGAKLRDLEAVWIDSVFTKSKEQLLAL
jgi:poly(A) polymerase